MIIKKDTNHFKRGQQITPVLTSGSGSWKVKGKYKGYGREIEAWVKTELIESVEIKVEVEE